MGFAKANKILCPCSLILNLRILLEMWRLIPITTIKLKRQETSLSGNETPLLACAKIGKIFIGEGQSFNSHTADTQGCVPYQAFQGPRGDQGLAGPTGPQGNPGPQGDPGVCP